MKRVNEIKRNDYFNFFLYFFAIAIYSEFEGGKQTPNKGVHHEERFSGPYRPF